MPWERPPLGGLRGRLLYTQYTVPTLHASTEGSVKRYPSRRCSPKKFRFSFGIFLRILSAFFPFSPEFSSNGRKRKRFLSKNMQKSLDKTARLWYNTAVAVVCARDKIIAYHFVRRSRVAGRARTIGNRVTVKSGSRVRISPSPPENDRFRQESVVFN